MDHFLFRSAYFWLCLPITVCLALLPRYISKAWKFGYTPSDIELLRWICKTHPESVPHEVYMTGRLTAMKTHPASASDALSRRTSRSSIASTPYRPGTRPHPNASCSRTDMSTGIRSVHRGFDFSAEEGGQFIFMIICWLICSYQAW